MSRKKHRIRLAAAIAIAIEVVLAAMLTFQVFPSLWAIGNAVFDYDHQPVLNGVSTWQRLPVTRKPCGDAR